MQNVIRKRARASAVRLPSDGRPLGDRSFFRSAGRAIGTPIDGLGNESAENSDCAGLGMALICTSPHVPMAQPPASPTLSILRHRPCVRIATFPQDRMANHIFGP